ncbi:6-phosphofructokinase [Deferribacterales bacterium RsTz2092]|nr:pyrophosphate--fructose 6-phosphate 1-phosphotransferase [Deferribacterales bacterium]
MSKSVIIGQSGGPTSVINASLAGAFEAAQARGAKHVYGMLHGIQGLLQEKYIDLYDVLQTPLHVELLKRTPSAYLGSCRFKLPAVDTSSDSYKQLFDILKKLDVGYFFYIGGNDSMDTIDKLSKHAELVNSDIRFVGIPKTIDNDVVNTDHTPGFASAAKYIAATVKEVVRDAFVYDQNSVTVLEIMGRDAGWLTASAALAGGYNSEGASMLCLPEVDFDFDWFVDSVNKLQKQYKSVVIAISEGIRVADGRYVCDIANTAKYVDSFGHRNLSGTAQYLSGVLAQKLNCKTRYIEFSTLQRCATHIASRVDVTEAYQVGGVAVRAAYDGHTGKMVSLKRICDDPYLMVPELVDVGQVANAERKIPASWVTADKLGVTDDFLKYVRPLVQGEVTPYYTDGVPAHLLPPTAILQNKY